MIFLGWKSFVDIVTVPKTPLVSPEADVYLRMCSASVRAHSSDVSISSCGDKIYKLCSDFELWRREEDSLAMMLKFLTYYTL